MYPQDGPVVWQQFVDAAVRLRRQMCEHVFQVRQWIVPVQRGGLNEAHDGRGPAARTLGTSEEPIFTIMYICTSSQ